MLCRCMNDFKLTVSAFSFERWKEWWSGEGVDRYVGWFGIGRNGFTDGGPHATSASGADCDVGMSMLWGESEESVYGYAVNV